MGQDQSGPENESFQNQDSFTLFRRSERIREREDRNAEFESENRTISVLNPLYESDYTYEQSIGIPNFLDGIYTSRRNRNIRTRRQNQSKQNVAFKRRKLIESDEEFEGDDEPYSANFDVNDEYFNQDINS